MVISGTVYGVVLNDRAERASLTSAFAAAPYQRAPLAPVMYIKPRGCIASHGATIGLADDVATVEVAATIGLLFRDDTSRVTASRALDTVGAACLALDVSVPHDSYYRPPVRHRARDGFLPVGDVGRFDEMLFEREIVSGDGDHGRLPGLGPDARLLWLLVEHFSDGHPVQLEERLINLASAPKALKESFRKSAPSEWLLKHVPWTQAEHAILAREARGRVAKLLQLRPGSACLVVERQTWDGETPVTFARLWHPGEHHRLVGRFEPRKY